MKTLITVQVLAVVGIVFAQVTAAAPRRLRIPSPNNMVSDRSASGGLVLPFSSANSEEAVVGRLREQLLAGSREKIIDSCDEVVVDLWRLVHQLEQQVEDLSVQIDMCEADDTDPQREEKDAANSALHDLEAKLVDVLKQLDEAGCNRDNACYRQIVARLEQQAFNNASATSSPDDQPRQEAGEQDHQRLSKMGKGDPESTEYFGQYSILDVEQDSA